MSEKKSLDVAHVDSVSKIEDGHSADIEWTVDEESHIRLKMDLRLIPTVFVLYLLCFIDRASIGNARIEGMQEDLALAIHFRFNWALTIFYISYIAIEIPSNLLLKVIGARYYLPLLVVSFGFISMCTSFVTNHSGLYACRFFLGVAEGGMMPGIAYYLSCFYRRKELMFRIGIFISGASLAGAFGSLLAAGLSAIPEWGLASRRLHDWRQIFFFEGIFTLIFAGLAILILPSKPDDCKFLNARERQLFTTSNSRFSISITLYAHFGFCFATISAQSLSLFLPTILRALGWTSLKTQFYTIPPYTVACVWSVTSCWLSDRFQKRGIFAALNATISMTGYIVIVTASTNTIRYLGVFFAASGAFPNGPGFLSWGINNSGTSASRAVTAGFIVAIGNLGAVIATWTYLPTDAPYYSRGHYINVAAEVATLLLAVTGILYTTWENQKRDKGQRDGNIAGLSPEQVAASGHKHPEFRYMS